MTALPAWALEEARKIAATGCSICAGCDCRENVIAAALLAAEARGFEKGCVSSARDITAALDQSVARGREAATEELLTTTKWADRSEVNDAYKRGREAALEEAAALVATRPNALLRTDRKVAQRTGRGVMQEVADEIRALIRSGAAKD